LKEELKDLLEIHGDLIPFLKELPESDNKRLKKWVRQMESQGQVELEFVERMRKQFPKIGFNEPPEPIPTENGCMQPMYLDDDATPTYYYFVPRDDQQIK